MGIEAERDNTSETEYLKKKGSIDARARGCCGVCWTCSWEPCPEGTPNAFKDPDGTSWMECGMCRTVEIARKLKEENDQLKAAISVALGIGGR